MYYQILHHSSPLSFQEEKVDFYVGQTFESREQFNDFLKRYQETNLVLFTKFKSKYVGKPEPDQQDTAEYEYLKLHCKNYGKPRVNTNLTGERPLQR